MAAVRPASLALLLRGLLAPCASESSGAVTSLALLLRGLLAPCALEPSGAVTEVP
jgi:hypothetical protein